MEQAIQIITTPNEFKKEIAKEVKKDLKKSQIISFKKRFRILKLILIIIKILKFLSQTLIVYSEFFKNH